MHSFCYNIYLYIIYLYGFIKVLLNTPYLLSKDCLQLYLSHMYHCDTYVIVYFYKTKLHEWK